jgi:hypothetical protein
MSKCETSAPGFGDIGTETLDRAAANRVPPRSDISTPTLQPR